MLRIKNPLLDFPKELHPESDTSISEANVLIFTVYVNADLDLYIRQLNLLF